MRWPIRRVEFAIGQRRHGRSGLKPVAVFRFLSEDWSLWIALVRMRNGGAGAAVRYAGGVFGGGENLRKSVAAV